MFSIKPPITEQWFVIFEHANKNRWHHRYLKPGFHHCYAMKKTEAGKFWIVVNPQWSHVQLDYRMVDTFPEPRDYAGDYCKIIEFQAKIDPMKTTCQLGILTCVDILKKFMGIKAFKVQTPYQLFKHLEDHNGQLLWDG